MLSRLSLKQKLLILLGLVSLASIVYLVLSSNPSSTPPQLPTTPTLFSQPIKLIYIDPPAGSHNTFWTTTAIEFKFDQPVNLATLAYKVTPQTDLVAVLGANPHSLYLRPKTYWNTQTPYQIIITSLRSTTNSPILTPINYEFTIVPPEDIISY